MVSAPPPKSNEYVLPPLLSTFISSGILLIDEFSFHPPMKGFSAADAMPTVMLATTRNFKERFSTESLHPFRNTPPSIISRPKARVTLASPHTQLKNRSSRFELVGNRPS